MCDACTVLISAATLCLCQPISRPHHHPQGQSWYHSTQVNLVNNLKHILSLWVQVQKWLWTTYIDITVIMRVRILFSKKHCLFMHEITIDECFIRCINFTSCLSLIYEDTILEFWMFIKLDLRCLFLRFSLSVFYSISLPFYLYWFFIVLQ